MEIKELKDNEVNWRDAYDALFDEKVQLEADNGSKTAQLAQFEAELENYKKWVDDLQSGMYINCVYCGHRYELGTQAVMQDVLYEHIQQCPKHPLSKCKAEHDALKTFVIMQGLDDELEEYLKDDVRADDCVWPIEGGE